MIDPVPTGDLSAVDESQTVTRKRWALKRRDERGWVMVWFGLMLTVLLGFAGFSVDLGNWYLHVQKAQRAADAAALAGDVYMPNDPNTAIAIAKETLRRNGVPETEVTSAYIAPVAARPSQLDVRVGTTVRNTFIQFLGLAPTSRFVRGASAEHLSQLHINSGQNGLGAPEVPAFNNKNCAPTTCWTNGSASNGNYWLQVAGTDTNKIEGDRFSVDPCAEGYPMPVSSADGNFWPTGCTTGGATGTNTEKATKPEDKYNFNVRLTPTQALGNNSWLIIQAYDPEFNDRPTNLAGNGVCDPYGAVPAPECPNDESYSNTWNWPKSVFGAGSNEPWTYFDLYESANSNTRVSTAACRNQSNGFAPTNIRPGTALRNPTWQEVCRIRVDPTKAETYALRVWTGPGVGSNHFMLRASYSNGGGAPTQFEIATSQTNINMSAHKNFGVYTATRGTSKFKLAQVDSAWAGRQVKVEIFDAADVYKCCKAYAGKNYYYGTDAGPITFQGDAIGPRDLLRYNCVYTVPGTGPSGPTQSAQTGTSGCGFHARQPDFKGQAVSLIWNVPANYRCTPNGSSDCWLYIQMEYNTTELIDDDTTWSMWQPGNPLRLVRGS